MKKFWLNLPDPARVFGALLMLPFLLPLMVLGVVIAPCILLGAAVYEFKCALDKAARHQR